MGNAITAAGTNNLLGIFGVQDALMHMFPDIHTAIGERMQLQDVVMPGKLELQVINVHQDQEYEIQLFFRFNIIPR